MGFYVMHRVEESYKVTIRCIKVHIYNWLRSFCSFNILLFVFVLLQEKMKERLAKYEAEMNRKAELNQNSKEEIGKDKAEILSEA